MYLDVWIRLEQNTLTLWVSKLISNDLRFVPIYVVEDAWALILVVGGLAVCPIAREFSSWKEVGGILTSLVSLIPNPSSADIITKLVVTIIT